MNIKEFQRKTDYKHYIVIDGILYFKSFHSGSAEKCYNCAFTKKACSKLYLDSNKDIYKYGTSMPCSYIARDGVKTEIEYIRLGAWTEYLKDQKTFIKLLHHSFNRCCGHHIHISEWIPKNISKCVPITNGLIQYECTMCGARSALLEDTGDDLNNLLRAYNFVGIDITRRGSNT